MNENILTMLYQNEKYLTYLRYHPKWYYYLSLDPSYWTFFERTVKKDLKITTYDKLESLKKQVNFASAMINYFGK